MGSLTVSSEPIPVSVSKTNAGWTLLRDGKPYRIRGAGGTHSLAALAAAGANSVRTWGVDENTGALLDEAHSLGLTVTLGIWLGHERHGFDYDDPQQVRAQLDDIQAAVEQHKDHPALLIWGIGNEMEGFEDGDNPAVWRAVEEAAKLVKSIDPHHPTMTVTAFVHGERIDYVHHKLPHVDIHGVNAYGGATVVHELLRAGDATKPFVFTEFGPPGAWEVPKTDWNATLEPTSTEKAIAYRATYLNTINEAQDLALGSYAFTWGHKMESTSTWYGMWLPDGNRVAAVDTMTELWSGKPPANRVPTVSPVTLDGDAVVDPDATITARVEARDPDDDPLTATWVLRADPLEWLTGGDYRATPVAIESAIVDSGTDFVTLRAPSIPGPYRLFYQVSDTNGGAATANIPLLVRGEPATPMPFAVYEDGFEGMPWVPSGWMGSTDKLTLDGQSTEQVYSGTHSIRLRYEGPYGWAAIAWQHPANNWGDVDGGFDVSTATELEIYARGQYGGEKVNFGVGLLESDKRFADSAIAKTKDITLTSEWQRYRIPLRRKDLSSIKTGFVVAITGRQTPVTVYLDRIRFVR